MRITQDRNQNFIYVTDNETDSHVTKNVTSRDRHVTGIATDNQTYRTERPMKIHGHIFFLIADRGQCLSSKN